MRGGKFPKEGKEEVESPNIATQLGGGQVRAIQGSGAQNSCPLSPAASVSHWGEIAQTGSVGKGAGPACSPGSPEGGAAGPSLGSEPGTPCSEQDKGTERLSHPL